MNVYERLFAALSVAQGKRPDKVPNHFVSMRPLFMRIVEENLEIKDEDEVWDGPYDLTIAKVIGAESIKCGPGFTNHPMVKMPEDYLVEKNIPREEWPSYAINAWGMIHKREVKLKDEFSNWYIDGIITDNEKFNQFKPLMEQITIQGDDSFSTFKKFAEMAIQKGICPIPAVGGPFTTTIEATGWSGFARSARKNPGLLAKIAEIQTEKAVELIKATMRKTGIKIFHMPDDIAMKNNVILTPKLMEEVFYPFFERYSEAAHEEHGKIFLHTDGFVEPLIKYFVEMGYDGVQCLESAAGVDIHRVKMEWGDKLCLIGNVDCNRDLFYLKPEEMKEKAKNMVESLKEGGGYIFGPSSTIYGSMPLENVLAAVDGWREAREY
ncbi:MAG: uroporphyrinogen decarboxylase family protein [Candidatus Hodarchaeota archaeon]